MLKLLAHNLICGEAIGSAYLCSRPIAPFLGALLQGTVAELRTEERRDGSRQERGREGAPDLTGGAPRKGDECMTMAGGGRVMRPGQGCGSVVALVLQFWSGIWNLCGRVLGFSEN